ncbi:MAG: DUF61 family protein [Candidatus Methanomethylophilaceae archaeon]|jgi:uncharacterized protein (UPF0216 family)|nr:DUF61 family protein [Candidatus Methanomethylophilaceae archaeon]NLF34151.1 DUF61 family protein [Thermoplasmatales archaeon]
MDIEKMIADMNRHVAVSRRTLLDHIESGDLTYGSRDGAVCRMEPREIEILSSICTETEKMRLKLPIFVSTDTSCPGGAWKVDGTVETSVVSRILKKPVYRDDMLRLYHPDLKDLRKILPNSVEILFLP